MKNPASCSKQHCTENVLSKQTFHWGSYIEREGKKKEETANKADSSIGLLKKALKSERHKMSSHTISFPPTVPMHSPWHVDLMNTYVEFDIKGNGKDYWIYKIIGVEGYYLQLTKMPTPTIDNTVVSSSGHQNVWLWIHLKCPHYREVYFSPAFATNPKSSLDKARVKLRGERTVDGVDLRANIEVHLRQRAGHLCQFEAGMYLELMDRECVNRMRVAKVVSVAANGHILQLQYCSCLHNLKKHGKKGSRSITSSVDSSEGSNGHCDDSFWVSPLSDLIHPMGWSEHVGHLITSSAICQAQHLADRAPIQCFLQHQRNNFLGKLDKLDSLSFAKFEEVEHEEENSFDLRGSPMKKLRISPSVSPPTVSLWEKGMKLEFVDPLDMSAIRVATVTKVLKDGFVIIAADLTWGTVCPEQDQFCFHISSPYLLPVGFSARNNVALQTPTKNFKWDDYLLKTKSRAVPQSVFDSQLSLNLKSSLRAGMKVEAVDLINPWLVCVATVKRLAAHLVKISFDSWSAVHDQWRSVSGDGIFPIGFCELVGYTLTPPKDMG